jgi:hypothetical protein
MHTRELYKRTEWNDLNDAETEDILTICAGMMNLSYRKIVHFPGAKRKEIVKELSLDLDELQKKEQTLLRTALNLPTSSLVQYSFLNMPMGGFDRDLPVYATMVYATPRDALQDDVNFLEADVLFEQPFLVKNELHYSFPFGINMSRNNGSRISSSLSLGLKDTSIWQRPLSYQNAGFTRSRALLAALKNVASDKRKEVDY